MQSDSTSYTVELRLVVDDQQSRFLNKAFDLGRNIYNATLGTALGQLQQMQESKEWAAADNMPEGETRNHKLAVLYDSYRLSRAHLGVIANSHLIRSGRNDFGESEAQNIGYQAWDALEGYMFKHSGKPKRKSAVKGICSIEGADLEFRPDLNVVAWQGHSIKVAIPNIAQIREAILSDDQAKPCRIMRKLSCSEPIWSVQVCVVGQPVGQPIVENKFVDLSNINPNFEKYSKQLILLKRKVERSKRQTNPENFNADGTCKKGKLTWNLSNRCKNLLVQISKYERRLANIEKQQEPLCSR